MHRRRDHQHPGRRHTGGKHPATAGTLQATGRAGTRRPLRWLAVAACLAAQVACSGTRAARTTRLADADLTDAVLEIRQQLADSRFLAERSDDSPPARLVLRRVENLSTDRVPVAEQWSLAARVLADAGMQELLRRKGITVQLPPEKVALLERAGLEFPDLEPERLPTHLLASQIASGTRAGSLAGGRDADIRKEYYLISFVIEDLQGRELLWQGAAELAREAEGTVVD